MTENKFEDQMNRLETIVNKLENESVNLDDAVALYEEGIKIVDLLSKQLQSYEKKIAAIDAQREQNQDDI